MQNFKFRPAVYFCRSHVTMRSYKKVDPELKTLECDILNPDPLINLEINNKRRTSIV